MSIDQRLLYLSTHKPSRQGQHQLQQLLKKYHYQNIPLTQLNDGHLILPIQVNESTPVYFLFDTGTFDTTLSIPYVNYLHIHPAAKYQTQAATDGSITFAEIELKKILFNPLQTFFAKPIVLEDSEASAANIAGLTSFLGVVGIMGLADMEKFHAIINMPAQSVFLNVYPTPK